jgi:hypothetical protein
VKNQPTRRLIQLLESARTHWSLKTSSGTGPVYWSIKCPFPNRSFNHNYCRVMGNYLSWVNRCAKSTMNCGPLQFPLNIGVRDDVCTAMFSQVPSSTRLSRWAWFTNIIKYPLLVLVLRICREIERGQSLYSPGGPATAYRIWTWTQKLCTKLSIPGFFQRQPDIAKPS